MSDVVLAQTPSLLLQGLQLPINAEPGYAFEQTVTSPITGGSAATFYTTPSTYYDVVTMVTCEFTTVVAASSRLLVLQVQQSPTMTLFTIPAELTQVASYAGFYTWTSSSSAGWGVDAGSAGIYQVMPLPTLLLYPGATFTILNRNAKPGDFIGPIVYTVTHVPTGPVGSNTDEELTPTPLVL